MKFVKEELTGGLVTSKDPRNLGSGELSGGQNGWYTDLHDGLVPAPAPFKTDTIHASSGSVDGLSYLCFNNGTERVLAETATDGFLLFSLQAATATGVVSATADSGIDASTSPGHTLVSYEDKYVLLNGAARASVIRDDLSVRNLGLLPVTAAMSVSAASATSNIWSGGATGYFDYWYTEVAELGGDPETITIESAYDAAGAATVLQENTADAIAVARAYIPDYNWRVEGKLPAVPRNTETTHYYVYRSEAKTLEGDPAFPIGERIGRVPIGGISSSDDTVSNGYVPFYDGLETESAYWYPQVASASGLTASGAAANDITKDSTTYADTTTFFTGGIGSASDYIELSGFLAPTGLSFSSVSLLNFGIKAKLDYYNSAHYLYLYHMDVAISIDGGATYGPRIPFRATIPTDNAWHEVDCGFANFGLISLTPAEVTNLRVRVFPRVLFAAGSGSTNVTYGANFWLTGLRMSIKYDGTGAVPKVPYPGIVINEGRTSTVSSRGGLPPVANLGCIFNGTLLTNDLDMVNRIRWSFPGKIDSFPTLYYSVIETGQIDEIVGITTVNNVCVVLLKRALVRVNYLPTEDDASFGRSRIWDFINSRIGCVNKKAWTKIVTPSGSELLVFVGEDGVYATNGDSCDRYDLDLNFWGVVDASVDMDASHILLAPEQESKNIMFSAAGASSTKLVPLSHSPRHMKGDRFKIGLPWALTGITNRSLLGFRDKHNDPYFMIGKSDGTVVTYKAAQLRPSIMGQAALAMTVQTRRANYESIGQEYRVDTVYLQCVGTTAIKSLAMTSYFTNRTDTITSATKTFPAGQQSKVQIGQMCEDQIITIVMTAFNDVLNNLVIVYDDQFGQEDQ